MIGCFYYAWYGRDWHGNQNWKTQTVRYNTYGGGPINGWYHSDQREIVEDHIDMAKESGIDYFIVSYNCNRIRKDYIDLVMDVCEQKNFKFCIHYEAINIFKDHDNDVNININTKEKRDLFFNSILNVSKFFKSKSYYKKKGKPVLFFYTSRRIEDLSILNEMKEYLKKIKSNTYLIGDEIWWNDNSIKNHIDRIDFFDAIYAYNLYFPSHAIGGEYKGNDFLEKISNIYKKYYKLCKEKNISLIPCIKPRYNDTGVRDEYGHYPLPPDDGIFFKNYYEKISQYSFMNNDLLICSFNEWFEDTQIEPYICDHVGDEYDKNPSYENLYLDIVKKFKKEMNNNFIKIN